MLSEKIAQYNIPIVKAHGMFNSASALLSFTKPLLGVEGFVVDFGGHKVKCKAERYVLMHKVKEKILQDRKILELIVNEELDDILPDLDETDFAKVKAYQEQFDISLANVLQRLSEQLNMAHEVYGGDKKRVALEFIPTLIVKEDSGFIFKGLDGKDLRTLVLDYIQKNLSTTTNYDKLVKWMNV